MASVVIIGSGNVATHLGVGLFKAGHSILQVWSQSMRNAFALAEQVGAGATKVVSEIEAGADLYLIALPDDAIVGVLDKLNIGNSLIAHTSGTLPLSVLAKNDLRPGVFYPLQTFSKSKPLDLTPIPFCIEAEHKADEAMLVELAQGLSENVQLVSSEQRQHIHLAAVFACNFTNHLYHIADTLLQESNLSLNLLKPLIQETAKKIEHNSPEAMQTGPAIRGDAATLEEHLEKLKQHPELAQIYHLFSSRIGKKEA